MKDCYCENQGSWGKLPVNANPSGKKVISCVCDFLKDYSDFANEKRNSDNDVNKLFEKAKELAIKGVAAEALRIEDLASYILDDESGRDIDLPFMLSHLDTINIPILQKLTDALDLEPDPTRLDKALFIEKFVDISHNEAPVLVEGCAYREKLSAYLLWGLGLISFEVFQCLSK